MNKPEENRYQSIRFSNSDFPVAFYEGRVSAIDRADRSSRVFHEEIEIKYFYEGRATLMVDTTAMVVQAGDVVVINPYEVHSTVELDEQKAKYHLFLIGLDCFTACQAAATAKVVNLSCFLAKAGSIS